MKINNMQTNINADTGQEEAFTLVELAIVLVIIGLIVSAVLVGQDLIRNAQTNSIIHQIDSYNAAVNSFREKFQALPGDFLSAQTYISTAVAANGDGNGLIATGVPGATPLDLTAEMGSFWQELSLMSLIDDQMTGTIAATILGTNFPYTHTQIGGIIAFADTDSQNYWYIGLTNKAASAVITTMSNLDPVASYSMDTKWDDGFPLSGIVTAWGGVVLEGTTTTSTTQGTITACVYSTPVPTVYNTSVKTNLVCQLKIKFS